MAAVRTARVVVTLASFHAQHEVLRGSRAPAGMELLMQYVSHAECIFLFFLCGAATQRGSWPPPRSWGFLDHIRRTTVGRTPLDKRSARRRDIYLTTHNTHNRQIHDPGGIRTHDFRRRAAADLRFRPRGHWERQNNNISSRNWYFAFGLMALIIKIHISLTVTLRSVKNKKKENSGRKGRTRKNWEILYFGEFDLHMIGQRDTFFIINRLEALISQNLFYFGRTLYMFRTVPLSIIRSYSLYTQQRYLCHTVLLTACTRD